MELSEFERLMLSEILEIRQHLEPEEDYSEVIDALRDGYPPFYPDHHISPEMSTADIDVVNNVMEMYRRIQDAYENAGLEIPESAQCPGFDGNNQTRLYGFLRFQLEHQRWTHVIGSGDFPNSHGFQPNYGRMWATYSAIIKEKGPNVLSRDDAEAIIAAG